MAGSGVVDPGLNMGAEDFSFYAKQVPGLFFFVGATPKGQDAALAPSNHSDKFFLDESALDASACARCCLEVALDHLHGGKAG